MKKPISAFCLALALLALPAAAAAQPAASPLTVDVGGALFYDAYPLSGTAWDFLLALFNLRGGGYARVGYRLSPALSLGADIGAYGMTATAGDSSTGEASLLLADIPLRADLAFVLGPLSLQGMAGASFFISSGTSTTCVTALDLGAKLGFLNNLYLEAAWDMPFAAPSSSFFRFGLGFQKLLL